MRLIDADALINRVVFHTDWSTDEKEAFEDEINAEPTIELEEEIIRCQNCDGYLGNGRCVHNDDLWGDDEFCSQAIRRTK